MSTLSGQQADDDRRSIDELVVRITDEVMG